jgi:hypothetical protein
MYFVLNRIEILNCGQRKDHLNEANSRKSKLF